MFRFLNFDAIYLQCLRIHDINYGIIKKHITVIYQPLGL